MYALLLNFVCDKFARKREESKVNEVGELRVLLERTRRSLGMRVVEPLELVRSESSCTRMFSEH